MKQKNILILTLFRWGGILVGLVLLMFFIRERSYYFLPHIERPLHPHAEFLKSSGKGGVFFGFTGTTLIFFNLMYLIRRQWLDHDWLGPLRYWMTMHVATGLLGGGFIVLHSTLVLRSAMGSLAFIALLVVIITGLIGRYIYSRVPRSLEGHELELDQIRKELQYIRRQLESYGFKHSLLDEIEPSAELNAKRYGTSVPIIGLIFGNRQIRFEFQSLKNAILNSPTLAALSPTLLPLAKRYCKHRQWFARYDELRAFMSSWRFFHRWFAILMLITVVFHIGLSMFFGNLMFNHFP